MKKTNRMASSIRWLYIIVVILAVLVIVLFTDKQDKIVIAQADENSSDFLELAKSSGFEEFCVLNQTTERYMIIENNYSVVYNIGLCSAYKPICDINLSDLNLTVSIDGTIILNPDYSDFKIKCLYVLKNLYYADTIAQHTDIYDEELIKMCNNLLNIKATAIKPIIYYYNETRCVKTGLFRMV